MSTSKLPESDLPNPTSPSLEVHSNLEYLEAEFFVVRSRVEALLAVQRGDLDTEGYKRLVEDQRSGRRALKQAREKAVEGGLTVPFHDLSVKFELDETDELMLLTCLSAYLSAQTWTQLRIAQGQPARAYLEAGFVTEFASPADSLVAQFEWHSHRTSLLRHGLLELDAVGFSGGAYSSALVAPHYVAAYVLGGLPRDHSQRDMACCVDPIFDVSTLVLDDGRQRRLGGLLATLVPQREETPRPPLEQVRLLVSGPPGSGKTLMTQVIARAVERKLYVVDIGLLVSHPTRSAIYVERSSPLV